MSTDNIVRFSGEFQGPMTAAGLQSLIEWDELDSVVVVGTLKNTGDVLIARNKDNLFEVVGMMDRARIELLIGDRD